MGRIPAGLLDAALSSSSGFAIGLSAAYLLRQRPELLGVYAVFFAAYGLAMVLPAELTLVPAEIASVRLVESKRAAVLVGSLRSGGIVALVASLLTLLSVPLTASIVTGEQLLWVSIATLTAAVFGPLEEHVRRVLHLAGRSWAAVVASGVMLVTSILAVVLMSVTTVDRLAIPLAALALSNGASLLTGIVLARPRRNPEASSMTTLRSLLPVGRWLVITGALPAGAEFIISALVTSLAGAVFLGYAEAARVVGQPVLVLGVGLLRVLGPQSMRAGQDRLPALGRKVRRTFLLLLGTGSVLYAMLAGWAWFLNPFARLVPQAYEISGLVLIVVFANALIGSGFSDRSELLGGKRERKVAKTEVGAIVVAMFVAASAGYTKAFARPLGRLGSAALRVSIYKRQVVDMYSDSSDRNTER